MGSAAADAQTRPAVEHLGRPNLNGQALPFSDAVRVSDVLYLSGQLGIGADGKLPEGIEAQTKLALDNIGGILKRAVAGDEQSLCDLFPRREAPRAQRIRRERSRARRAHRARVPGLRRTEVTGSALPLTSASSAARI
jgi:hypothetical protein